MALESSNRTLLKATHTSIDLDPEDLAELSRAVEKSSFIASLALQDREIAELPARFRDVLDPRVLSAVAQYEPARVAVAPPDRSVLRDVSVDDLQMLGEAVFSVRQALLDRLQGESLTGRNAPVTRLAIFQQTREPAVTAALSERLQKQIALVRVARQSIDVFVQQAKKTISPIGLLHLERIEMVPAGIERGELLATIPLAPGETTAVEQIEWSVTEEDLSTIVTDSLEEYTELGVTEKSELAQASTTESKRSQQLGLSASVSGSYGLVTFSTTSTFNTAIEASQSRKESRTQAKELTSKASSRVKKERKVTIQTKTVTGTQETTTRQLVNASPTDPMRVDYFSMIRKWRVRLFQYGLRQTYDITIPSPGASLRSGLEEIDRLTEMIDRPFEFKVKLSEVRRDNYRQLAEDYGAVVPDPPQEFLTTRIGGPIPGLANSGMSWIFHSIDFDIPENYEISDVWLDAMLGNNNKPDRGFAIFGYGPPKNDENGNPTTNPLAPPRTSIVEHLNEETPWFLIGQRGHQAIQLFLRMINAASVTFAFTYKVTAEAFNSWQTAVWQAIRTAAVDAYNAQVQAWSGRREALWDQISNVDTLTMRREERDEIVRNVLRWLLGPSFVFMPKNVVDLFTFEITLLGFKKVPLTGNQLNLSDAEWEAIFLYEEMVKFLHQAIEWENLLYFLYPYFWDLPDKWSQVRQFQHPSPERQQFLRAGSARVVLTVRPGFERAFAEFVDTGSFGTTLLPTHPYIKIGDEIKAFNQTNYPGVPPANPTTDYRSLLTPDSQAAWSAMTEIIRQLEIWKTANGSYPTTAAGLAALPGPIAQDPWGNNYVYASPGKYNDYELSSMGPDEAAGPAADGTNDDITSWASASLIAEWHEYTPSRGIDIDVNSDFNSLA